MALKTSKLGGLKNTLTKLSLTNYKLSPFVVSNEQICATLIQNFFLSKMFECITQYFINYIFIIYQLKLVSSNSHFTLYTEISHLYANQDFCSSAQLYWSIEHITYFYFYFSCYCIKSDLFLVALKRNRKVVSPIKY